MKNITIGGAILAALTGGYAHGFSPITVPTLGEQTFIFFENEGRQGRYIYTTSNTPMNIQGSDVFNGSSDLASLTTSGTSFFPRTLKGGSYRLDVWFDGPISFPLASVYCFSGAYSGGCDYSYRQTRSQPRIENTGFFAFPDYKDTSDNNAVRLKLGQGYINYLQQLPVGDSFSQTLNYCTYSDNNQGGRCLTQAPSNNTIEWKKMTFNTRKVGHATFRSNQINTELEIDSNGNVEPLPNSKCIKTTVDRYAGIACEIARYHLSWDGSSPFNQPFVIRRIGGYIVNQAIGLNVGTGWHLMEGSGGIIARPPAPANQGEHVMQLFISQRLINSYAAGGKLKLEDIAGIYWPENWGFNVMFSGDISLIPRAQTVAIKSADGAAHPYLTGEVGKDDLTFKYELNETGYSNATKLELRVRQDSGIPYRGLCTFYPTNQVSSEYAVPVPTQLEFATLGQPRTMPVRCDGTPIDLRAHSIKESRSDKWYEAGWVYSRFYNVDLRFLLTDEQTSKTVDGNEWEGEVHQSGTITLTGTWN